MMTNIIEKDSWLPPIEDINNSGIFLTSQFLSTNIIHRLGKVLKVKTLQEYKMEKYTYPNFPKDLIKSQLHLDRYINFIDSRPIRIKKSKDLYTENHHKVPRALRGSNLKENMVLLTGREYFIAHLILWKAYGGKMANAFWMMSISQNYNKLTSKQYASIKYIVSEKMRKMNLKRDHSPMLGRKHSKETIKKLSESHIGQSPGNKGLKCSQETKNKISIAQTGKKYSEETKLKKSKSMTGKKWTEKQKEAQSKRFKIWYEKRKLNEQ